MMVSPPAPRVSPNTVLATGFVFYMLATIWPPLIMFATYLLYQFIPYAFHVTDDATNRRKLWVEFEKRALKENGELKRNLFPDKEKVILEEKYWVNARGMCLSTSTMVPKDQEIRAVVCFCHGYIDNASFMKRWEYQRLVRQGIAIATIEHEGHGRSDGLLGYIPNWDDLIDDAHSYFAEITQSKFPGKKCFLLGESMGGAVAFDAFQRNPEFWKNGVIFIAPMCKISDKMMPPKWVENGFRAIVGPAGDSERMIGTIPAVPAADISSLSYKLDERREMAYNVPIGFFRKPRLATGRELLLNSTRISKSLKNFNAPFLVMHGLADKATDPKLSQSLYDESQSKDKEIKLYEGMWHTLTSGEPSENIDIVFNDIISWIDKRL